MTFKNFILDTTLAMICLSFISCATDEEQASSSLNSYAIKCPSPNTAMRSPNAGDPYSGDVVRSGGDPYRDPRLVNQFVRSGGDPYADPSLENQFVRSGGDPYADPSLDNQFVRSGGDPYTDPRLNHQVARSGGGDQVSGGSYIFNLSGSAPYVVSPVITFNRSNTQMVNAGDPLSKGLNGDVYRNAGDPSDLGDRQLVNAGNPLVKDSFKDTQPSYQYYDNPCL